MASFSGSRLRKMRPKVQVYTRIEIPNWNKLKKSDFSLMDKSVPRANL